MFSLKNPFEAAKELKSLPYQEELELFFKALNNNGFDTDIYEICYYDYHGIGVNGTPSINLKKRTEFQEVITAKLTLLDEECWTLDLILFKIKKLHDRDGYFGPSLSIHINNILKEDLDKLSRLLMNLF